MKNLFISYGKTAKWALKYLMWFILRDLRKCTRTFARTLSEIVELKWRIIKEAKTFRNFKHSFGSSFNEEFFTPPQKEKRSDFNPPSHGASFKLQIHKLVASLSWHAMVSSFLWRLIRFPQKTKFFRHEGFNLEFIPFTYIFMFFVAFTFSLLFFGC